MAVITQEVTDRYAVYNGDCVEVLPELKAESVHLTIYSPPFAELYNYSSSERDMSNCRDYAQFLEHYEFLVSELARVTKPGRISCVHCMDVRSGNRWRDMPGDFIRLHERHGLYFHSRHVIWKEPLRVAIRTRALGLMHKQIVKDSSHCYCAMPDHILVFRKAGQNQEPIVHPTGFSRYSGGLVPPHELVSKYQDWKDQKTNKLSHWIWQHYASCVWMDIRAGRLLPFKQAKENEEEKHVCPLQLDVIERCLALWSNPGDVVLTPFMGVGSEVYCALKAGRKAIGVELKPSYYRQALRNIQAAVSGTDEDDQFALKLGAAQYAEDEQATDEEEEQVEA